MNVYEQLSCAGVVPVLKIARASDAVPLCRALARGGLNAFEITFRTDAAAESIALVREAMPDACVGAGTVLSARQVDEARAAGAQFIVSPGLNSEVVSRCQAFDLPVVPGCATASEVGQAVAMGLTHVKFFPAEAMGGVKTVKSLAAPFAGVTFMPTGGVTLDNLNSYLSLPCVFACGGTYLAGDALVREGAFDKIEQNARDTVAAMHGFALVHVGINHENEAEGEACAKLFESLFGWTRKVGGGADFAGPFVECMKKPGRGTKGHIAVACNNLKRAKAYFLSRGVLFAEDSETERAIYFKEEISGFAVHLLQR